MRKCFTIILPLLTLAACEKSPSKTTPPTTQKLPKPTPQSQVLKKQFPLLPLIEKQQWQDLTDQEEVLSNPNSTLDQKQKADQTIQTISTQLKTNHPFQKTKTTISLGKITYLKNTRQIIIPAKVNYPNPGDTRHPGELELILCTEEGRTHETLFTTTARPLHLELLLHLTGFIKNDHPSAFNISISLPNTPPIPINQLIATKSELLPKTLTWEFSGANFQDLYPPDQTGDLIICWHAHHSVLRTTDPNIASGQTKLIPKKHPALDQNTPVKLILTPLPSS